MPSHKSMPRYGPLRRAAESKAKKHAKEAKSATGTQSKKKGRREHRDAPDDTSSSSRSQGFTQLPQAPSLRTSNSADKSINVIPPVKCSPLGAAGFVRQDSGSSCSYPPWQDVLEKRKSSDLEKTQSFQGTQKMISTSNCSGSLQQTSLRTSSSTTEKSINALPRVKYSLLGAAGFVQNDSISTDSCSGSLQQTSSRTSSTKESINPPSPLPVKYTLLGAAGLERRDSGSSGSYGSLRPAKQKKKLSNMERRRSLEGTEKAVDDLIIHSPGSLQRVVSSMADVEKKKSSNSLPPMPTVDKKGRRSLLGTERAVDELIIHSPGSLRQASSCTKMEKKKKSSNLLPPKPPVDKNESRYRLGTERSVDQPIIQSPASLRLVSSCTKMEKKKKSSNLPPPKPPVDKNERRYRLGTEKSVDQPIMQSPASLRRVSSCTKMEKKKKSSNLLPPKPPVDKNERRYRLGTEKSVDQPISQSPASLRRVSSLPNKFNPQTSRCVANIATTVQNAGSNVSKDSGSVRSYCPARISKSNASKKSKLESKSVTSKKDTSAEAKSASSKQDETSGELSVQEPPGFFYLHDEVASVDSSVTSPESLKIEELSLEDLVPESMSKSVTFDDTVYIKTIPGYGPLGRRTKLHKKPSEEGEENVLENINELHEDYKQEDTPELVSQPSKINEDLARDKTEKNVCDVSANTGGAPDIEGRSLQLKEWLTAESFDDTVEDSILEVRSLDGILPVFDDAEAMECSIEVTYESYRKFEQIRKDSRKQTPPKPKSANNRCCESPDEDCEREDAEKENLDVVHLEQAKQQILNQDQDASELDLCVGFWTCQDPENSTLPDQGKDEPSTPVDEEHVKAVTVSDKQGEGQRAAKPHTPEKKPKAAVSIEADEKLKAAESANAKAEQTPKATKSAKTKEQKQKAATTPTNAKPKEKPKAVKSTKSREEGSEAGAKSTNAKTEEKPKDAKSSESERLEAASKSTNVKVEEEPKHDMSTIAKGKDNPKAAKPTKTDEMRGDAASSKPDEKLRKQNSKLTKYEQRTLGALVQAQQNLIKMMKSSDIQRVNELKEANADFLKTIKAQIKKTEAVMIERIKGRNLVDSDKMIEERLEENFMLVEAALREQQKIEDAFLILSQRERNYAPRDIWTAENVDVPPALKRGLKTFDYDGMRREIANEDVSVEFLEEAKKAMAEQLCYLRALRPNKSCMCIA